MRKRIRAKMAEYGYVRWYQEKFIANKKWRGSSSVVIKGPTRKIAGRCCRSLAAAATAAATLSLPSQFLVCTYIVFTSSLSSTCSIDVSGLCKTDALPSLTPKCRLPLNLRLYLDTLRVISSSAHFLHLPKFNHSSNKYRNPWLRPTRCPYPRYLVPPPTRGGLKKNSSGRPDPVKVGKSPLAHPSTAYLALKTCFPRPGPCRLLYITITPLVPPPPRVPLDCSRRCLDTCLSGHGPFVPFFECLLVWAGKKAPPKSQKGTKSTCGRFPRSTSTAQLSSSLDLFFPHHTL